jgi:hypothetical protein
MKCAMKNLEIISKASKIVAQNTRERTYCALALIYLEGFPTASTITDSKAEGINWITSVLV